jgi:hypothetical protein
MTNTNFPNNIDQIANPNSTDALNAPSHSDLHTQTNEAILAIETVIGVTNSNDSNSITYKINNLSTAVNSLGNATDVITELFGLDGNNDLTVNGIENATAIDTFAIGDYRTAEYALQISRGAEYYFSNVTALHDNANIYVSESDIISNTNNNLADISFEINNGIISLVVIPTTTAVTARYYRTALK